MSSLHPAPLRSHKNSRNIGPKPRKKSLNLKTPVIYTRLPQSLQISPGVTVALDAMHVCLIERTALVNGHLATCFCARHGEDGVYSGMYHPSCPYEERTYPYAYRYQLKFGAYNKFMWTTTPYSGATTLPFLN